ncbi:GNAT family N-acetyltransferase [Microvirga tunisiensis]|uniref:GNAT family N-acetyltransferase n=1 Tax=Pannonibacter tanglangensis TaxID=2750084 RepID=A0A7X5F353_9HYPH|nr:GNAT family N-acetyltransferase [Pannonibacter sp. XCT-53]
MGRRAPVARLSDRVPPVASIGLGPVRFRSGEVILQDTLIREATAADLAGILAIYPRAFPDEDLVPVVRALAALPADEVLSLVAERAGQVVGHVLFTRCRAGQGGPVVALLAPLCVTPELHRQGLGGRLVRAGLAHLAGEGIAYALVLGDPAYYSRFGFRQEPSIATPYPLPAEWASGWQGLALRDSWQGLSPTCLVVPAPWQSPSLWQP